jgi:hypothetical protein
VPLCHLQLEGDFVSASITDSANRKSRSQQMGPLVVKAPIAEGVQIEGLIGPLDFTEADSLAGQPKWRNADLDSLASWLKVSLAAGQRLSIAARPGVAFSPARGLRRTLTFVFGTPLAVALPASWSLTLDPEADLAASHGALGWQNLLAVSHPLGGQRILLIELSSQRPAERSAATQHSAIVGLDYVPVLRPQLHLDVGAGIGLNSAWPAGLAYVGFSIRL